MSASLAQHSLHGILSIGQRCPQDVWTTACESHRVGACQGDSDWLEPVREHLDHYWCLAT